MSIILKRFRPGRKGLRGQQGQAYAEFALILPLLLLMILVIVDLGRISYTYATLHNAVREGARFGAVDFNWDDTNAIAARTKTYAIGLNQAADTFTVTVNINESTEPYSVQVEGAYKFRTASPILWILTGSGEYTLRTQSTMLLEYILD